MGTEPREAHKADDTSEPDTIDGFCDWFSPDLDDDIIDGENEREKQYRHTNLEFFDKNWSDLDIAESERNSFDTKYFSQEYAEDIYSRDDKKFIIDSSFTRHIEMDERIHELV